VGAAAEAVRSLFTTSAGVVAVSWLAIAMIALSAFSLARRISRVYASIFALPSLRPDQLWRALVWILLQVTMFVAASFLRGVYRDSGPVIFVVAASLLLTVWFVGDVVGYRLLVPQVPRNLLIPSAIVSTIGRIGVGVWSTLYMPATLSEQAEQFGPIGVTFSIFTLILVGTVVNLAAPVIVTVWDERYRGAPARVVVPEGLPSSQ
jgi:membrane protein